jgi:hypothetical protein
MNLEKSLEQHGFREYSDSRPIPPHENATSLWQIRIKNNAGQTLYFITAFFYEKFEQHLKDGIEFEAHLYPSMNNKHWITLEFHGCDQEQDIHIAMEFFRHAYHSLWCQPDIHNQ